MNTTFIEADENEEEDYTNCPACGKELTEKGGKLSCTFCNICWSCNN